MASLLAYTLGIWGRISKNPAADVLDIFDKIARPAIRRMVNSSNDTHLKHAVAAFSKAGTAAQIRAAAADISGILEARIAVNVDLITGLTDQQRQFARDEIGFQSDIPLERRLNDRLGVSSSRARLIASDQVAKLNSVLSSARAQAAGAAKYQWSTSGDERVRQLHRELNGNIYKYGDTTGAEDGLEPGQPIRCRCIGITIFD